MLPSRTTNSNNCVFENILPRHFFRHVSRRLCFRNMSKGMYNPRVYVTYAALHVDSPVFKKRLQRVIRSPGNHDSSDDVTNLVNDGDGETHQILCCSKNTSVFAHKRRFTLATCSSLLKCLFIFYFLVYCSASCNV